MATLTRSNSQNVSKPTTYKDYVNFLGAYNQKSKTNHIIDQISAKSSDSGISFDKSNSTSTSSLNSNDVTDNYSKTITDGHQTHNVLKKSEIYIEIQGNCTTNEIAKIFQIPKSPKNVNGNQKLVDDKIKMFETQISQEGNKNSSKKSGRNKGSLIKKLENQLKSGQRPTESIKSPPPQIVSPKPQVGRPPPPYVAPDFQSAVIKTSTKGVLITQLENRLKSGQNTESDNVSSSSSPPPGLAIAASKPQSTRPPQYTTPQLLESSGLKDKSGQNGEIENSPQPAPAVISASLGVIPPPPPPMMPPSYVMNRPPVMKTSNINQNHQTEKDKASPQIDKNDPAVKKLVYGALRTMYGAYHEKANDYVATLPRNMVKKETQIQNIINNMASNGDLDKLTGRGNPKKEDQ